ncbi:MAG: prepilin-type N-terminal cleavage/methylation domain-containing protein [bacterium]|nr:prepilin-type N-terminal cleavage/methylation domain-containing protein [bacterium]
MHLPIKQCGPTLAACRDRNVAGNAATEIESSRRGLRSGVTLIELLVVIGVLTLLATLSLSTVKNLLKDQKVTQASRLVQQYIETAKIRAITSRRPVAVFVERVGKTSDGTFDPANFTATRLSMGEVFPAYAGDIIDATGTLWDVDFTSSGNPCRMADRHADQIRFAPEDVFSGLGTQTGEPGFVRAGDLIQFEGSPEYFLIEDLTPNTPEYVAETVTGSGGNSEFALTFFNPPRPDVYNNCIASGNYSTKPPALPIFGSTPSLMGPGADTPSVASPRRVKFRIFRRPTKSLVGAITLPRGTCIDLWASGTGRSGAGLLDAPTPVLQANETVTPASYSRIAIVFDPTGKPNGIFQDNRVVVQDGTGTRVALDDFAGLPLESKLYLLVGRTDQVNNTASRPAESDRETVLSNILDASNSWISINPLTGLVSSSPVYSVPDALVADFQSNNATYADIVNSARTFASVGVNDVQK